MLIRTRRDRRDWQGLGRVPDNIRALPGMGNSRCIARLTFPGNDIKKFTGEPGHYFSDNGFYNLGRRDDALGLSLSRPMSDLARLGWTSGLFQSRASSNLRQFNNQLTQYFTWADSAAIGVSGYYSVANGILSITPQLLTPAQRALSGYFNPITLDTTTAGTTNTAGSNAAGPIVMSINAGTLNSGSGTLDFNAVVTSGGAITVPSGSCVNMPDYTFKAGEPPAGSYQATGPNGAVAQVNVNINWNNFNRFVSLALTTGPCTMGQGVVVITHKPPNVVGGWLEYYGIAADRRTTTGDTGVGEVDPIEFPISGTSGSSLNIYNIQQHLHNGNGYGGSQLLGYDPTAQFISSIAHMTDDTVSFFTAPGYGQTAIAGQSIKKTDTVYVGGANLPLGIDPMREKYWIFDYALGGNDSAFGPGVIYLGVAPPAPALIQSVEFYQSYQQSGP